MYSGGGSSVEVCGTNTEIVVGDVEVDPVDEVCVSVT